ncbi:lantibiotic dehydratase [Mucilaginibacter sp.]|uniref:lantibiotic dehydratase n=1 Tax=Mucilaginibacter sp. TaxID=1882438 RepID=UPI0032675F1B
MEQDYTFFDQLFLRAPYYSFALYEPERLPEVLGEQVFRNAIFLASPGFYRVMEKKAFDFGRLSDKEQHTLYKYYNRMCFRPTPFGSFASFTMVNWHASGITRLKPDREALLHLLPDRQQMEAAEKAGPLAAEAVLSLNPLLYRLGKDFRFIHTAPGENGNYAFGTGSFPAVPFYKAMLRYVRGKTVTAGELVSWMEAKADCSPEEALSHLQKLLKEQILLSGAMASLIGPESQPPVNQLRRLPLMAGSLAQTAGAFIWGDSGRAAPHLFYAALERPLEEGGPDPADKCALEKALHLLQRLAVPATPSALKQFAIDFEARFGQEAVPLLLALDPDYGIAYGDMATGAGNGTILDGIPFPPPVTPVHQTALSPAHHVLLKSWLQNPRSGRYAEVQLRDEDLEGVVRVPGQTFPKSTAVLFRKTAAGLCIEQAGGAAATSLIGRFSVFSEEVYELCRKLAAAETEAGPGTLFADIGQLSGDHVDNINRRMPIYPYEIPLNAVSNLPVKQQLPPGDLLVCVRNGEVLLYSARYRRQVIPRLATAYNPLHNPLGIFRFLCDLQYQGSCANLSLDPGRLFPGMDFYPRVSYQKVVLSLARWHLGRGDIDTLNEGPLPFSERLANFRQAYGLPLKLSVGHADQQLVFDLANRDEAGFFAACLKGLDKATLYEYLPPGKQAKCGHLPLAGQYAGFLHHKGKPVAPAITLPVSREGQVARNFLPGSEWLYLKLYCTPFSADKILEGVILPLVERHRKLIRRWFFIRYAEGGHHIRLRFHLDPADAGRLMASLSLKLKAGGYGQLVKNLQGDTYRRELERYGPQLMGLLEDLFEAGSELHLHTMVGLGRRGDRDARSEFRLGFAVAFYVVQALSPGTGLLFAEEMTNRFLSEFKAVKATRVALGLKFRELRGHITELAALAGPADIRRFDAALEKIRDAAGFSTAGGQGVLLADMIHMQLNRTFQSSQRKQEMLVYYCLHQHLRSLKSRK